jgi:Holliday junction resolvase RusA-like endonuclease
MTIRIPFIPSSVNHTYRFGKGRVYKDPSAKATAEQVAWEIRAQYRGPLRSDDITLTLVVTFDTRRRRDTDNILKQLFDAGTGIIWKDDSQIADYHVTRQYGNEPLLELTIVDVV